MRISPSGILGALSALIRGITRPAEGERGVKPPVSPPPGRDEVVLSDQAKLIAQLRARMKEMPNIREDRVREIAERLARGEVSFTDAELAEAILRTITEEEEV
ncbi:MAG: flagellar biosynthesis anti-sigma factor FlgM [Armatimonadota bacterium]|nr:flagellar biosynthesis anti-sigma factor FlgM [Armatimonadota bacterium]